jgi:hypothetical protein
MLALKFEAMVKDSIPYQLTETMETQIAMMGEALLAL